MRKLVVTLSAATAIVFAGALAWQADAAPWRGAATVGTAVESVNPVEEVACRGWGSLSPGPVLGLRAARMLVPSVLGGSFINKIRAAEIWAALRPFG